MPTRDSRAGVGELDASYDTWQLYYTTSTAVALSYDALPSVHPLSRAAASLTSPADVAAMLDPLSMHKVRACHV